MKRNTKWKSRRTCHTSARILKEAEQAFFKRSKKLCNYYDLASVCGTGKLNENPKILHEGDIPETNRNINHMLCVDEKYYSYQRGILAPSHMNFIKSKKKGRSEMLDTWTYPTSTKNKEGYNKNTSHDLHHAKY